MGSNNVILIIVEEVTVAEIFFARIAFETGDVSATEIEYVLPLFIDWCFLLLLGSSIHFLGSRGFLLGSRGFRIDYFRSFLKHIFCGWATADYPERGHFLPLLLLGERDVAHNRSREDGHWGRRWYWHWLSNKDD